MNSLYLSALHKSSGKTVLTAGIGAALTADGYTVQPFKKGPDYIDPMWLSRATGRRCFNLDYNAMTSAQIQQSYSDRSRNVDVVLVEGNKGLHDGMSTDGGDSNAALAKLLQCPVVLVVDASGIMRSVAPMVNGFHHFDPEVNIAGLILNKTGSARHEGKLLAAVDQYCDLPVLGCVRRNPDALLDERHLGLLPIAESPVAGGLIQRWRDIARDAVDMGRLVELTGLAGSPAKRTSPSPLPALKADLTIAIARGKAFSFYYPDDLEHLIHGGAQLVDFDPMFDERLPPCDALFIGGGFPECHLAALEDNQRLRAEIHRQITQGLPVYAECGGLMYLAETIRYGDENRKMVGAIRGSVTMHPRPQGRGFTKLRRTSIHPWQGPTHALAAHEFHHSALSGLPSDTRFAYRVERGAGVDGQYDGILIHNVLAAYSHLRDVGGDGWTREFLAFIRKCKRSRNTQTMLGSKVRA